MKPYRTATKPLPSAWPQFSRALVHLLAASLLLLAYPVAVNAGAERQPSRSRAAAQDTRPASEASAPHPPTLKELPRNILRDQKFLWLRPFRLQRTDLPWLAALLGTTAGLIALDRPVGQELSDTPPGAGFAFSRRVSQLGGGLTDFGVAGAFYLIGRWRGDARARTTGLLGLEAVADSLIIVEILKTASQRPRPTRAGGRLRNQNAEGEFFTGGRSFPSGHAAEAFALATVVAQQYRHRRWLPPTAYGLAGLVAVARLTQRKHFPADTFVGSVLGYLIGRHVWHAAHPAPTQTSRRPAAQSLRAAGRWLLLPYVPPGGGAALTLAWQF
ncbi:MAG: phosphatase PAP2 family protein [Terriglobia bacterium]